MSVINNPLKRCLDQLLEYTEIKAFDGHILSRICDVANKKRKIAEGLAAGHRKMREIKSLSKQKCVQEYDLHPDDWAALQSIKIIHLFNGPTPQEEGSFKLFEIEFGYSAKVIEEAVSCSFEGNIGEEIASFARSNVFFSRYWSYGQGMNYYSETAHLDPRFWLNPRGRKELQEFFILKEMKYMPGVLRSLRVPYTWKKYKGHFKPVMHNSRRSISDTYSYTHDEMSFDQCLCYFQTPSDIIEKGIFRYKHTGVPSEELVRIGWTKAKLREVYQLSKEEIKMLVKREVELSKKNTQNLWEQFRDHEGCFKSDAIEGFLKLQNVL